MIKHRILLSLLSLLFMSACSSPQRTTDTPQPDSNEHADNLLANPSFEQQTEGWSWLSWSKGWSAFESSNEFAKDGNLSLKLPLRSDQRSTIVYGGVQEIELQEDIPNCIDGYYYINDWNAGDWKQYLQLVVIDLSHDLGPQKGQAQLRYIITGTEEPPFNIANARYLFLEPRKNTPTTQKWVHFSVDPKRDFMNEWNYTPGTSHKLRILFEARYDHHSPQMPPASADVYFDNLYFGQKKSGRCNQ